MAGQHFVTQHPQRPQIGRRCRRLTPHLLWSHVRGCPENCTRSGDLRFFAGAGNAEVQQLRRPVRQQHNIGGFDVAVNNPRRMNHVERPGDLR